jgi:hypothetical protein
LPRIARAPHDPVADEALDIDVSKPRRSAELHARQIAALDESGDCAQRYRETGCDVRARQQLSDGDGIFLAVSSHASKDRPSGGARTRTFRPFGPTSAEVTELDLSDVVAAIGSGLDKAGLARFRDAYALHTLATALKGSDAFWRQAAEVVEADDAYEIAGRYGSGPQRRALIGRFIFVAAYAPDHRRAAAWIDLCCMQTWWVEEPASPGSREHYALRPDYTSRTKAGAEAIARRGASRCLACGTALASSGVSPRNNRRVRRDYCSVHERDPLAKSRNEQIACAFRDAARGFQLPLPTDLALLGGGALASAWIWDLIRDAPKLRPRHAPVAAISA